MKTSIGFIGLGVMGTPMALNLVRSGVPLTVWSRSDTHYDTLRSAGAAVAGSVDALLSTCETVVLMLAHQTAIDEVLGRRTPRFGRRVSQRLIVNMSTTAPGYSRLLADEIRASGDVTSRHPCRARASPPKRGSWWSCWRACRRTSRQSASWCGR